MTCFLTFSSWQVWSCLLRRCVSIRVMNDPTPNDDTLNTREKKYIKHHFTRSDHFGWINPHPGWKYHER